MATIIHARTMDLVDAESPPSTTIDYLPETLKERILRNVLGTKSSMEFVLVAKDSKHMSTVLEVADREARKPRRRL